MRISDLISELEECQNKFGDIEVMSSSNYGDYHQTEQLDNIESIEPCVPVNSAYSNSGLAFPEPDEEMNDEYIPGVTGDINDSDKMVLILRYKTGQ